MPEEKLSTVNTGLANIPVCSSEISHTTVDKDGKPILLYRGFSIYDLVQGPFEESAYLILEGDLPTQEQLVEFSSMLKENGILDERVVEHIETYPKNANMMDLLHSTLSFARMFDRDYENTLWQNPKADPQKLADLIKDVGIRMGAMIPAIMAYGYRIKNDLDPIPPDDSLSFAANLLQMLGIEPEDEAVKALDRSLTLYLDHTTNCSTFTARVTESSGVDPYGPPMAASVALKGVLHGGANEITARMLDEIGDPDRAERYILNKLARRELVIGFGHRLPHYRGGVESRVKITEEMARVLAENRGLGNLFKIYDVIIDVMKREKGLAQNLDLPTCLLYRALGIPSECNTPIFQTSRYFGWVAHMAEQRLDKGPLYRPTQEYTGPTLENMRKYVLIEERG